ALRPAGKTSGFPLPGGLSSSQSRASTGTSTGGVQPEATRGRCEPGGMTAAKITPEPPAERPRTGLSRTGTAAARAADNEVGGGRVRPQGGWYRGASASSLHQVGILMERAARVTRSFLRPPPVPGPARADRPARGRARGPGALVGAEGLRTLSGADQERSQLGLLRGPAHRQRQARRAPRRGARVQ